jgi:PAS domain S-box-containing protein
MRWLQNSPSQVNSIELRVKTATGQWTYIELTGNNMIGISNVDAIVMTYRDIQAKKAADNALAHAEQRMSMLLNNTKESFIIVNKRLRIVTYNKAAQECSPYFFINELQSGLSLLELIPAAEVESTINTFELAFEGDEAERETNFTDAEGCEHIYSHTYRPLFSGNEITGVFITSTDITERKHADHKLRASEERYRTIIQESFDATVIKDANSKISDVSPAIEKILGFQPHELVGKTCFDFLHDDYVERVQNGMEYVLTEFENEISMDTRMLDKWKRYVWVEMKVKNMLNNKHIKGIIVLLRDITERKRSEEIISLSEQRFRGLVQSGADMISIIDEEGYIRYSSPTVNKVLGTNPSDDIGRNVFELMHQDDRDAIVASFDKMLHSGNRQQHFGPYRFPDARGDYRWLETVVTNLSDDPAIRGIVINSRDVTHTKRLNEEQQALTNELIKNNQDLQQFSFITSHNLRAPAKFVR